MDRRNPPWLYFLVCLGRQNGSSRWGSRSNFLDRRVGLLLGTACHDLPWRPWKRPAKWRAWPPTLGSWSLRSLKTWRALTWRVNLPHAPVFSEATHLTRATVADWWKYLFFPFRTRMSCRNSEGHEEVRMPNGSVWQACSKVEQMEGMILKLTCHKVYSFWPAIVWVLAKAWSPVTTTVIRAQRSSIIAKKVPLCLFFINSSSPTLGLRNHSSVLRPYSSAFSKMSRKWNREVRSWWIPISFTQQDALEIHSCYCVIDPTVSFSLLNSTPLHDAATCRLRDIRVASNFWTLKYVPVGLGMNVKISYVSRKPQEVGLLSYDTYVWCHTSDKCTLNFAGNCQIVSQSSRTILWNPISRERRF